METQSRRVTFTGKGIEFFALMLLNAFLTMFTLGIYHFWAKISVQKFLNRNTRFCDEPLDFHGTGKEKFIGFLKAGGIILLLAAAGYGISIPLSKIAGAKLAISILTFIFYIAIIALTPMILVGKRRYLLSRSSWRGVRFIFTGKWKKLAAVLIKGILLSIATLGIYAPWFFFNYRTFMISNSCFGTERFVFSGKSGEFAKLYYKGLLLTIITVGFYYCWMAASLERYFWNNTAIQGKKISCDLTGWKLFKNGVVVFCLIFFTFTIGTAWAMIRILRVHLGSLSVDGDLDFEAIKAAFDANASAFADGLTDAADALDSLANFLG